MQNKITAIVEGCSLNDLFVDFKYLLNRMLHWVRNSQNISGLRIRNGEMFKNKGSVAGFCVEYNMYSFVHSAQKQKNDLSVKL